MESLINSCWRLSSWHLLDRNLLIEGPLGRIEINLLGVSETASAVVLVVQHGRVLAVIVLVLRAFNNGL